MLATKLGVEDSTHVNVIQPLSVFLFFLQCGQASSFLPVAPSKSFLPVAPSESVLLVLSFSNRFVNLIMVSTISSVIKPAAKLTTASVSTAFSVVCHCDKINQVAKASKGAKNNHAISFKD